jgi:hypothetical protein
MRPYLLTLARFQWKLGLVVVALGLSALHDFVLGPRAGAPAPIPGFASGPRGSRVSTSSSS